MRSNIFVLASDWHGFPRIILEVMSAGLSVVFFGISGREVLVGAETGSLAQQRTVEVVAARFRWVIGCVGERGSVTHSRLQRFAARLRLERLVRKTLRSAEYVAGAVA